MTGHGDVALAVEAMKAGAADFIEKPFDDAALLGAIRAALDARAAAQDDRFGEETRGRSAIGAICRPENATYCRDWWPARSTRSSRMNSSISPRTVEVYRANLMAKTGARSMSELMRLALAAGL